MANVAVAWVEVRPDLDGFERELGTGLKSAEKDSDAAGGKAGKAFGDAYGKALKWAAGAFAATKVIGFANDAINAASDLEESASKVAVVFGESAGVINEWSESSATALGLSQQEALAAAGTLGNLFTAMGQGQDAAAAMSKDVVGLAADLGSFNNMGTDEVLEKLRAGLLGEAEPLKSLGVAFGAAQVEAKAMELGLADANGEISEGAKIQARYALIIEQTKAAQGDFARTSDGLANKQKIMAAQFENAKAKLGAILMPAMAAAVSFLADKVIPAFSALIDYVSINFPIGLQVIRDALQRVWDHMEPVVGFMVALWHTFGDDLIEYVRNTFEGIKLQIEGVLNIIRGIIKVVTDLISGDWSGAWDGIKQIVEGAWQFIRGSIERALAPIRLAIGAITSVLGEPGEKIKEVADGIAEAVGRIPSILTGVVADVLDAAKSIGGAILDGIRAGFDAATGFVGDVVDGLVDGFINGLATVWNGIANTMNSAIKSAVNALDTSLGPFVNFADPPNVLPTIARRQYGGPVSAGRPYLVGEAGPELLIPGRSGYVLPNSALAGLGAYGAIDARITVTGNVYGVEDLDAWADRRDRRLRAAIRAGAR